MVAKTPKSSFWQRVNTELQPRSIHESRWAAVIVFVTVAISCVLMTAVDVIFGGKWQMTSAFYDPEPSILNGVIIPVGVLAAAAAVWALPKPAMRYAPIALVILATSLITLVNFLSGIADLTSQAFFMLSVLYSAYTFRLRAAGIAIIFICANEAVTGAALNQTGDWLPGSLAFIILNIGVWLGFGRAQANRHEKETALKKLATQDALTGLANRSKLERLLQKVEKDTGADSDGAVLLLVDLDLFKSLNDCFGHPFGDEVLKNIAQHLTEIDHPAVTAARIGGDELAVFLPDCSLDTATTIAESVLARVRATKLTVAGETVTYSVSIGAAHWPTSRATQPSLYSAADVALYDAKRNGRNQFQTYTPDSDQSAATKSSSPPAATSDSQPVQSSTSAADTGGASQ